MSFVPQSDSPQTLPAVPETPRSWNFQGHSVPAPLGYPSAAANSTGVSSTCVYVIKNKLKKTLINLALLDNTFIDAQPFKRLGLVRIFLKK